MKKFTVPCLFDMGTEVVKSPFNIYVGEANPKRHPLYYQAMWLKDERGGDIPPEVMDSFQKLRDIAVENGVSLEELAVYALGQSSKGEVKDTG